MKMNLPLTLCLLLTSCTSWSTRNDRQQAVYSQMRMAYVVLKKDAARIRECLNKLNDLRDDEYSIIGKIEIKNGYIFMTEVLYEKNQSYEQPSSCLSAAQEKYNIANGLMKRPILQEKGTTYIFRADLYPDTHGTVRSLEFPDKVINF